MTRTDNFSKSSLSARHLPISVKAYRQYCERFRHTFCTVFNMPDLYDEAIAALDKYLDSASSSDSGAVLDLAITLDSGSSPYVALAFHMIKSEIDISIARSKSARQRAAARKAARIQPQSQSQPQSQPQHQSKPQPSDITPKQSTTPIASSSTPITPEQNPAPKGTVNSKQTTDSITQSSDSIIRSTPNTGKNNRPRRSILQRIGKPSPRKFRHRH